MSGGLRIHDPLDLVDAISDFETYLPGWWWSIGSCSASGDASCGPDVKGPDAHLLVGRNEFDNGFHADLRDGTPADALREVMCLALAARENAASTEVTNRTASLTNPLTAAAKNPS